MELIRLALITCMLGAPAALAAQQAPPGDPEQQRGRAIFEGKGNCWSCHGKEGRGTVLAPNLTDSEWLNVDGSAPAVRELIEKGVPRPVKHPAPMPPMGGAKLSGEELDAVTAYVLSLVRDAK
jgi:mono/diheme cytochrome c family protein